MVRMLSTRRGSPDGVTIETHEAGQVYDLPASLAAVYLREQWAEEVKIIKPETPETAGDPASLMPQASRKGRRRRG